MKSVNKGARRINSRLLSIRRIGAYFHLVIEAPGIAESARAGNFVAIGVGGPHSSMLLHRAFAIYRSRVETALGPVIELIVARSGKGSEWLTEQTEGCHLAITGPLGTAFPLPAEPVNVAVIGGGYGAAPLFDLADDLKARGCRVDAIIGASNSAKIFAPLEGKRNVNSVTVMTEDGSAGSHGRVTDLLPELIERQGIDVIYSCGPMAMLAAVDAIARRFAISHQVSVEEAMACGIGICMTCVLPMKVDDEVKLLRSCVDGPVIDGEKIAWQEVRQESRP